ncbi:hypothetical protein [Paraburkholderia sp. J10-1]|uniref:hypothetical protein n=1 Tax=Paraburkholderia sp. J10-1 TaxID=2805430 RepID=UPI002AB69BF0|nr:hypothetical protein [Paraburkholderia sp. J10-1]
MGRTLEEFCAAYRDMHAARGQFERHAREGTDPDRPGEILLLTSALNAATYRYLAAVNKLGEIDAADRQ